MMGNFLEVFNFNWLFLKPMGPFVTSGRFSPFHDIDPTTLLLKY